MMSDGPIPLFVHGVIEYLAAVLLVVAPFVLGFDSGAATALSIVLGVVILAIAASTDGPTSLVNQIPASGSRGARLRAGGGADRAPLPGRVLRRDRATALFIVLGVAHLLVTIGTRFRPSRASAPPPRAS